eukprot:2328595-Pleurochrysis_carterae.AAC.2
MQPTPLFGRNLSSCTPCLTRSTQAYAARFLKFITSLFAVGAEDEFRRCAAPFGGLSTPSDAVGRPCPSFSAFLRLDTTVRAL